MKLLTYPDLAKDGSKLWHICQELGIEIVNDIDGEWDKAIYWNIKEFAVPNVINIRCTNIYKDAVDAAWYKASGYSITIDPRNYGSDYVRKSKNQYISHTGERHDGRVFTESRQPEPNYVYQKYINTKTEGEMNQRYVTVRVPIFGKHIPCLYIKGSRDPFKETRTKNMIIPHEDIGEWISKKELGWLFKFCEIMGVDFAEIDMLRDVDTREIYAIDVNNIAGDGMYGKLQPEEVKRVKKMFAESFRRLL